MPLDFSPLDGEPRLLMEVPLRPIQGTRFQPTGFPDLGAATYRHNGQEMLLVESAQSMANRMELACWDAGEQDLISELRGLPYIRISDKEGRHVSNSLLEAHRINSEYIIGKNGDEKFKQAFVKAIEYQKDGRVNWGKFRTALFKYDPNNLVHGCFLEEIGGRLRVTRALSGFIEACGVDRAESGGVKNNIVQPDLKGGEGNVPYHRTEYTAKHITAYFNLDISLMRSYGLPAEATRLLFAFSLFKIRRFLSTGLRLRTACDLEPVGELQITKPKDHFTLPAEGELLSECSRLVDLCKEADLFADPSVTQVTCKS